MQNFCAKAKIERSLPVRGAWIEIAKAKIESVKPRSLPVRGAWIEIPPLALFCSDSDVAPRKGSVD